MTTEEIVKLLNGKRSGSGWSAKCPAHEDRRGSLSIGSGEGGRTLLHCHAECTPEAVCAAMGWTLADLMPGNGELHRSTTPRPPAKPPRVFPTCETAIADYERRLGPRAATWMYHDAEHAPCGAILRWNNTDGTKDIRPISRNGSGWTLTAMPEPRPLYRMPDLRDSGIEATIYIVEGEKCCDALVGLGLLATTSAHGSGSAGQTDWSPLAGRSVVVLPDHDKVGAKYAADVTRILHGLNSPAAVRVVDLPGLADGEDVVDWLPRQTGDAGAELQRLVNAAPVAMPEAGGPVVESVRPEPWRPFPIEALPERLRDYVLSVAGATSTDPSFAALSCLVITAGCLGNRLAVVLKRGWTEPCVLWGAVIGVSSSIKTPVFRLVTKPIIDHYKRQRAIFRELQNEYIVKAERYKAELAEWRKARREGATDPPIEPTPPKEARILVSDITVEKLGSLLNDNPLGLLVLRDELAGWLGAFDRYSAGGKGSDQANWISMFNATHVTIDRKSEASSLFVERAAVSLLGTIQPSTLRRIFAAPERESGLLGRFLVAYPPFTSQHYSNTELREDLALDWDLLLRGLIDIPAGEDDHGNVLPRFVGIATEAKALFIVWHDVLADSLVGCHDEDLQSHWGKLKGIALRLALLFECIKGLAAGRIGPVSIESMRQAIAVTDWFKTESARLYSEISIGGGGQTSEDRQQRRLIEWIRGRGGAVTVRDVARNLSRFSGKPEEARKALDALAASGAGRWVPDRVGPKGGRQAVHFVLTDSTDTDETPSGATENRGCGSVGNVGDIETA